MFHGELAKPRARDEAFSVDGDPYEGFYASRVLTAQSSDAAVTRARELIREELDATLLRGRQGDLISLEVEEIDLVDGSDDGQPNKGFTFY